MNSRRPVNSDVMLLSLSKAPAILFEVMDKEPSLIQIWIECLVLGIGGLVLARYRYWLAVCVLAFALVLAWLQISELRDPFVGPDIVREAGHNYVVQSYLAITIALMLPTIGAIMGWRKTRKRAT
jgi:hypothetical protein